MNGATLLDELYRLGLEVARDRDRIRVWPAGRITPKLADLVREHRQEVLEALPTEAQAARIRAYAAQLGGGGEEWGERLLRFVTREQAERVLAWLERRAASERQRETAK